MKEVREAWTGLKDELKEMYLYILLKRFCEWSEDKLQLYWLKWKYRKIDPDLCCCGQSLNRPDRQYDSICQYGGCKSAKEYAFECDIIARDIRKNAKDELNKALNEL